MPAVVAAAVAAPAVGAVAGTAGGAAAHDLHVSHTRLVVEGRTVVLRVRCFRDDLDSALVVAGGPRAVRTAATAAGDSALLAYVRPRLAVRADGAALQPRLTARGEDRDVSGEPAWWFVLEYEAAAPVRRVAVRHTLLFETFATQQNLVQALRAADGARASLFFAVGEDRELPLEFRQ